MISIIKVTYKVYAKYFTKSIRENTTYNCNVRTINTMHSGEELMETLQLANTFKRGSKNERGR